MAAAEVVFGILTVEECEALVVAARRLAAASSFQLTGQTLDDPALLVKPWV